MPIPLAKSAFVFENGNLNRGSDFAKATTDRWHGVHRVKMR